MKRVIRRYITFWLSGLMVVMGVSTAYGPVKLVSASETAPEEVTLEETAAEEKITPEETAVVEETTPMDIVPAEMVVVDTAITEKAVTKIAPEETGSAIEDERGDDIFRVSLPTEKDMSASGAASEAKSREDVFQAVLATDTDHIFDFIMDPQGLISKTDAVAYGDCVFEEGATLFFRRHDGECEEDYSNSSDALVITNRGKEEVEIILTASISFDSVDGIVLSDDRDFTDDMDASLYLALTDGEETVSVDRDKEVSIHTVLEGVSEDDETCSEYRFWLTGAVNEKGDWSEVEDMVPKVTVTWNVTQEEADDQEESADGAQEETEAFKMDGQEGKEQSEDSASGKDMGQEEQRSPGPKGETGGDVSEEKNGLSELGASAEDGADERDTEDRDAFETEEDREYQAGIGTEGGSEDQVGNGKEGDHGDQAGIEREDEAGTGTVGNCENQAGTGMAEERGDQDTADTAGDYEELGKNGL